MWCPECEPYKDRLDREVGQERKFKNKSDICARKWVGAERYKGICRICTSEGKENETPKAEAQGEERILRCTLQPLRKVWMTIGMEKVDTHEGITVKALPDSGATRMFVDRKFIEKHGFKLEKLEQPVRISNVDGTYNSGGMVTHEIECNVYHKGHVERMRLDVCDLGRTEVILGMPWLAAHNPEIDWEKGEVRMTRCPPICGKNKRVEKASERKEAVRRQEARKIEEKKAINWAANEKKDWGREEEMEIDH